MVGGVGGRYFRPPAIEEERADSKITPPARHPGNDPHLVTRPAGPTELSAENQNRLRELEMLAASDPRLALTKLSSYHDPDLLHLAQGTIAKGWARTDPAAAAQWVADLPSAEEQVSAMLGLVPVWAAKDPEACLLWGDSLPAGDLREVSLTALADEWAFRAPGEALKRYLSLRTEQGVERGLFSIISQWALDDPGNAIATVAALDPSNRRDEFLETVLVSLGNKDPDLAWSKATLFNDPSRVEHVRCEALGAMAESRPQDALRLAASAGDSPVMLKSIAVGWASWDTPAAKAWIATLPDTELAESLRKTIGD